MFLTQNHEGSHPAWLYLFAAELYLQQMVRMGVSRKALGELVPSLATGPRTLSLWVCHLPAQTPSFLP